MSRTIVQKDEFGEPLVRNRDAARRRTDSTFLACAAVCFTAAGILVWFSARRAETLSISQISTVGLCLVNLALIAGISRYSLRRFAWCGLIHTIFVFTLGLLVAGSTLILLLFAPTVAYITSLGPIGYVSNPFRLQMALMYFLVTYSLAVAFPIARISVRDLIREESLASVPWAFEPSLVVVSLAYILLEWVSLPGPLSFSLNLSRNFLTPGYILVGARWSYLSKPVRWFVGAILLGAGVFNLISNARFYAIAPLVYLAFGFLISPEVSQRRKHAIVAVGAILLPVLLVLGNQSREVLGAVGHDASFGDRINVFSSTVASGQVITEHGAIVDMAMRFFPTGANSILVMTPEAHSFVGMNVMLFSLEFLRTLAPSFLTGVTRLTPMEYVGSTPLIAYGHYISETTSVEVNLLGSLYRISGWPSLLVGGFVLGFLFQGVISMIGAISKRSAFGFVLLAATLGTCLNAPNWDAITLVSNLVWGWIVNTVFFVAVLLISSLIVPRKKNTLR